MILSLDGICYIVMIMSVSLIWGDNWPKYLFLNVITYSGEILSKILGQPSYQFFQVITLKHSPTLNPSLLIVCNIVVLIIYH